MKAVQTSIYNLKFHNVLLGTFSVEKNITVKSSTISPSIIGAYWYIGQYEPTGYTNPENDLI